MSINHHPIPLDHTPPEVVAELDRLLGARASAVAVLRSARDACTAAETAYDGALAAAREQARVVDLASPRRIDGTDWILTRWTDRSIWARAAGTTDEYRWIRRPGAVLLPHGDTWGRVPGLPGAAVESLIAAASRGAP